MVNSEQMGSNAHQPTTNRPQVTLLDDRQRDAGRDDLFKRALGGSDNSIEELIGEAAVQDHPIQLNKR